MRNLPRPQLSDPLDWSDAESEAYEELVREVAEGWLDRSLDERRHKLLAFHNYALELEREELKASHGGPAPGTELEQFVLMMHELGSAYLARTVDNERLHGLIHKSRLAFAKARMFWGNPEGRLGEYFERSQELVNSLAVPNELEARLDMSFMAFDLQRLVERIHYADNGIEKAALILYSVDEDQPAVESPVPGDDHAPIPDQVVAWLGDDGIIRINGKTPRFAGRRGHRRLRFNKGKPNPALRCFLRIARKENLANLDQNLLGCVYRAVEEVTGGQLKQLENGELSQPIVLHSSLQGVSS